MNRATRGFCLLLSTLTAACAAEVDPETPDETEPPSAATPEHKVTRAIIAPSAPAPEGAKFSARVLDRLAERGIEVHGGPKPQRTQARPERTTVELPYIVPGFPMDRVPDLDPTGEPMRYATHIEIRKSKIIDQDTLNAQVDPKVPGDESSCSGTLVGNKAVLTAAHCVTAWKAIAKATSTSAPIYGLVPFYTLTARPRRNGSSNALERAPHGTLPVKTAVYRPQWPGATHTPYQGDHDFAVLGLRIPPTRGPVTTPSVRVAPTAPQGLMFEAAHYPSPGSNDWHMYYSLGDVGALHSLSGSLTYSNVWTSRVSIEPGSSGGGLYEFSADGVVGLTNAESTAARQGARRVPGMQIDGFVNRVLLFSAAHVTDINGWIAATN